MSPRGGVVRERLRLFYRVALETGSEEDAMWVVLEQDRRERTAHARGTSEMDQHARAIVDAVCRETGLSRRQLLSHCREWHLLEARQVAMRALRDVGYSLPAIGLHLKRDHCTVFKGLNRIGARQDLIELAERVRIHVSEQRRAA